MNNLIDFCSSSIVLSGETHRSQRERRRALAVVITADGPSFAAQHQHMLERRNQGLGETGFCSGPTSSSCSIRHVSSRVTPVNTQLRLVNAARPVAALTANRHNPVTRCFYNQSAATRERKESCPHRLMRKLLTILNAMLHSNQPWQSSP